MKLTDTQLVLLSAASQREDGGIIIPDHLKGAGSHKPITKLVVSGLVSEVPKTADLQEWRRDEEGRPIALVITEVGLQALGLAPRATEDEASPPQSVPTRSAINSKTKARSGSGQGSSAASRRAPSKPPRGAATASHSPLRKTAQLIALLQKPKGSGIAEIATALGWLPHTTRAALTGLRKRGFKIDRERSKGGASTYRITGEPPALADTPSSVSSPAGRKSRPAKTPTKPGRQKTRSSRRSGAAA